MNHYDPIWATYVGNTITAICYFVIPFFMYRFIKARKDLPFSNMWLLFGAFIGSCGIGHALHVVATFYPEVHVIAEHWRVVTAAISLATALKLPSLLKVALTIPSPEQLREINFQLAEEVKRRVAAEAKATTK